MGMRDLRLRSFVRGLLCAAALFVLSGSVNAETWHIVDLREGRQQSIRVDGNLEFSADLIEKRNSGRVLKLVGESKVTLGEWSLEAENISVLPEEELVIVLEDSQERVSKDS